MRAKAVKINDKEWIAEMEDKTMLHSADRATGIKKYFTDSYPIPSESDRAWLEKSDCNGKEIEGDCLNIGEGKTVFYLHHQQPIHSDPAGEDIYQPKPGEYGLMEVCRNMVKIAEGTDKDNPQHPMFWYWFGMMNAIINKQKP